ncbi:MULTISPECIES: transposase [Kamptonema]|uniref:transposase n=1 Tax=Kamptonema TaxID=1501433 RepID=UPI003898ECF9
MSWRSHFFVWQTRPCFVALIDWLKKAEPYYKKSANTIKRWFSEIVGYFEQRTNNGIVEGINNKLKLLKRRGYLSLLAS